MDFLLLKWVNINIKEISNAVNTGRQNPYKQIVFGVLSKIKSYKSTLRPESLRIAAV